MKNIMSVDVEDWFHILELDAAPNPGEWRSLESRVEKNLRTILAAFEETGVKATFFFLGWVAEHFPQLVRETRAAGHEIASHGYGHQLVYTQSREEFSADVERAKKLLEDITGEAVLGYRAPGFSVVAETPWALEELARHGYRYDSSIFPATRGHGGMEFDHLDPCRIRTEQGEIVEFPISVVSLLSKRICFFGGGYLRLFPYPLIRAMARRANAQNRPVNYYFHPREIDPDHPRLPMNAVRKFKSYINLHQTMPKVKKLMAEQELGPFRDHLPRSGAFPVAG